MSQDINDAIHLYRDALACHSPGSHPGRGLALNNLATALYVQGMTQEDYKTLAECIQLYRDGLLAIPLSEPTRVRSLTNLADAVQKRVKGIEDTETLDEVIELQREATVLCLPTDFGTCLDSLRNSVLQKHTSDIRLSVISETAGVYGDFIYKRPVV
ncbi:hypothetical protein B0H11DRAFT_1933558 [Mycena galericulata]|nr:hypothetical protein B0H11DRAFT_1933558 [Mycena galericulata]